MPTIVGVKLRFSSKVLSFDPADTTPEQGEMVVVETERGSEIGEVIESPHEVADADLAAPLKPVLRIADADDVAHQRDLEEREREALPVFREMIKKHDLDMKPIDVEYLFDGSKIVFYFSAEERVDFRELVRDLAAHFKARIDMRQVGVRDEARMVGGIGHCGQPLCCVRFPGDFQPVSIRMAKEQDLPLNPLKISGLCGRLMCCLRYEYDAYKDFKSRAPKRKAIIDTPLGPGKVTDLNTPRETVSFRLEDGQFITVPLAVMQCPKEGGRPCAVPQEALESVGAVASTLEAEPMSEPKPRSRRGRGDRSSGKSQKSGSGGGEKKGDRQRSDSGKGQSQRDGSKRDGSRRGGSKRGGKKRSGDKPAQDRSKATQGKPTTSDSGSQGKGGQTQASGSGSGSGSASGGGRRRRRRRTPREGGADNGGKQA